MFREIECLKPQPLDFAIQDLTVHPQDGSATPLTGVLASNCLTQTRQRTYLDIAHIPGFKEESGQEDADSDYPFGNCLQRSAFRSTGTAHESFIRAKAINTIQTKP